MSYTPLTTASLQLCISHCFKIAKTPILDNFIFNCSLFPRSLQPDETHTNEIKQDIEDIEDLVATGIFFFQYCILL